MLELSIVAISTMCMVAPMQEGALVAVAEETAYVESSVEAVAPLKASNAQLLSVSLAPYGQFNAQFNQSIVDATGKSISDASGSMTIAQPNKLHWNQLNPSEQIVVTNGATLWLYDADFEQVTIRDMSEGMNALPAAIFAGDVEAIESTYQVDIDTLDTQVTYQLTPIVEAAQFKLLVIKFNDGVITDMIIEDYLGQVTTTQFSSVESLASVDPYLFEFVAPSGVEIIDDRI